jgi:flagellar protein FlaJ
VSTSAAGPDDGTTDRGDRSMLPSVGDLRALAADVVDSYRYMDMPVRRYVGLILLPAVVVGLLSLAAVAALPVPTTVSAPLGILGVFVPGAAIAYPKVVQDRKRKQIRERFYLFLTHVTILSMTNIERVEVFRTLAGEDEYAALAEEMGHLVALMDTWNQSLDDACRRRAKRSPSPLLSDFFERLAYTVSAGQELQDFLVSEQDVILQQFVNRYKNDLRKIDVLKELYLSMTLSTTFLLVFAVVLPVLVGVDPTLVISGVLAVFVLAQASFVLFIHMTSPYDLVWYLPGDVPTPHGRRIRRSLAAGVTGSLLLVALEAGVLLGYLPVSPGRIPFPLYVAIPLTPLLFPGLVTRREEQRVTERDAQFASFVRALGVVESVKQTSTSSVLDGLKSKDFGALTDAVVGLYRRLRVRVDDARAWRLFAAETGSYLIQKFGDMYVTGRQMGGDPDNLGRLISSNLGEVLKLREQRAQEVTTIVGIIYGLTAAAVFAFFIGLEVVELLIEVVGSMDIPQSLAGSFLYTSQYDLRLVEYLLLVAVLANALLSSLMVRVIDRGHYVSSFVHFVALTWLGVVVALVTKAAVDMLMSV